MVVVTVGTSKPPWITVIMTYIEHEILSTNLLKVGLIKIRSHSQLIIVRILYKRGFPTLSSNV